MQVKLTLCSICVNYEAAQNAIITALQTIQNILKLQKNTAINLVEEIQ